MSTRRGFFKGLLAAACTAVARAYVPAALVVAPRYVDKFEWKLPTIADFLGDEDRDQFLRMVYGDPHYTVRFTLRDGTPSPTVQAWLDECGDIVTKHMRAEA